MRRYLRSLGYVNVALFVAGIVMFSVGMRIRGGG